MLPNASPSTDRPRKALPRIGLLGGSFNPAHGGHRRISLFAARALGLDEVWWLVSPGNPLKPKKGMAPLSARVRSAKAASRVSNPLFTCSRPSARRTGAPSRR